MGRRLVLLAGIGCAGGTAVDGPSGDSAPDTSDVVCPWSGDWTITQGLCTTVQIFGVEGWPVALADLGGPGVCTLTIDSGTCTETLELRAPVADGPWTLWSATSWGGCGESGRPVTGASTRTTNDPAFVVRLSGTPGVLAAPFGSCPDPWIELAPAP